MSHDTKKKIVIAVIALIVILTAVLMYKKAKGPIDGSGKNGDKNSLRITTEEKDFKVGDVVKLRLLTNVKGAELDVTNQAEWSSSDKQTAMVATADPIKGQLTSQKPGEVMISAKYQGETEELKLNLEQRKLEIKCRAMNFGSEAKRGDKVLWGIIFTSGGTPQYTYAWSGSDGLKSIADVVRKAYNTAGKKTVKVAVRDYLGATAEADCEINIE